jgi:hypothetical protein
MPALTVAACAPTHVNFVAALPGAAFVVSKI